MPLFLLSFLFFFFFQAEDGIRDLYVTGVQTCALPIFPLEIPYWRVITTARSTSERAPTPPWAAWTSSRSEERRVGKECRSRWSPYDEKKNKRRTEREGCSDRVGTAVEGAMSVGGGMYE